MNTNAPPQPTTLAMTLELPGPSASATANINPTNKTPEIPPPPTATLQPTDRTKWRQDWQTVARGFLINLAFFFAITITITALSMSGREYTYFCEKKFFGFRVILLIVQIIVVVPLPFWWVIYYLTTLAPDNLHEWWTGFLAVVAFLPSVLIILFTQFLLDYHICKVPVGQMPPKSI